MLGLGTCTTLGGQSFSVCAYALCIVCLVWIELSSRWVWKCIEMSDFLRLSTFLPPIDYLLIHSILIYDRDLSFYIRPSTYILLHQASPSFTVLHLQLPNLPRCPQRCRGRQTALLTYAAHEGRASSKGSHRSSSTVQGDRLNGGEEWWILVGGLEHQFYFPIYWE